MGTHELLLTRIEEAIKTSWDMEVPEIVINRIMESLKRDCKDIFAEELHSTEHDAEKHDEWKWSPQNSAASAVTLFFVAFLTSWWITELFLSAAPLFRWSIRAAATYCLIDTTLLSYLTWQSDFRTRKTRGTEGCVSNHHRPNTAELCPAQAARCEDFKVMGHRTPPGIVR